ncbi:MAG: aquaporin family protein [Chloroflexi bacterium]|nr:aquaporin family protein [Chloroflexota bacterium]
MRRNTLTGQLWAEFFGTVILVLLGNGVVANFAYATRLGAGGYDWTTITLGWAFAVVVAVYIAGGITGAHLNPAVTMAAIVRGSINATTGLMYIVVQVLGGIFSGFLVHMLYLGNFVKDGYKNVFHTAPAAGYENLVFTQYFSEILGTFILVLAIYAVVDNVRNVGPGANLWPFMVGMVVLSIGLSLGGPTGYAINPARDFGPRLYASLFVAGSTGTFDGAYFLVPIIGPLIGGPLGALFYDFLVKPFLPAPDEPEPEPRGADVAHQPA